MKNFFTLWFLGLLFFISCNKPDYSTFNNSNQITKNSSLNNGNIEGAQLSSSSRDRGLNLISTGDINIKLSCPRNPHVRYTQLYFYQGDNLIASLDFPPYGVQSYSNLLPAGSYKLIFFHPNAIDQSPHSNYIVYRISTIYPNPPQYWVNYNYLQPYIIYNYTFGNIGSNYYEIHAAENL